MESSTDAEALAQAVGDSAQQDSGAPRAVVTYIDLVAAFDSISHKFLDQALEEAQCSTKTRAIFRAIYSTATAVVRVTPPGGGDRVHCEPFPVHRGCIQGDNFSPVCFIVALEYLMRKADTGDGVRMLDVFLSKLEYADDAALINRTCEGASRRVTRIAKKARELADMEISVPKT